MFLKLNFDFRRKFIFDNLVSDETVVRVVFEKKSDIPFIVSFCSWWKHFKLSRTSKEIFHAKQTDGGLASCKRPFWLKWLSNGTWSLDQSCLGSSPTGSRALFDFLKFSKIIKNYSQPSKFRNKMTINLHSYRYFMRKSFAGIYLPWSITSPYW